MMHQLRNIILLAISPIKDIPIFGCFMLLMVGFLTGFIMPNYNISELSKHGLAAIFSYFGLSIGILVGCFILPVKTTSQRIN